jgi:hypothetical protein
MQHDERLVGRVDEGTEADELVLDHLATLGCDLRAQLRVAHFLYLPGRAGASAVARVLERDGWASSLEECDNAWLVVATRTRVLNRNVVRETRSTLEALATAHGGIYDGWEAEAS